MHGRTQGGGNIGSPNLQRLIKIGGVFKMKTKLCLFGLLALSAPLAMAQYYPPETKPFHITIGGHLYQGDLQDPPFDIEAGFVGGIDYYMYPLGENTMSFLGVRGWFSSEGGTDAEAYGVHYGVRLNFGVQDAGTAGQPGQFYARIAAGYYNNRVEGFDNEWGFGGFAAIGYDFGGQFSAEIGYEVAPETSSIENHGWFGAIGVRI